MAIPDRPTVSEFVKTTILVFDPEQESRVIDAIPVLFNPTEYSVDKTSRYSEQKVAGNDTPQQQWMGGDAETLSMELLFDTYDEKVDVRVFTERLDALIRPATHKPPVCRVVWGSLVFKGTLEQVRKQFTMFLPGGIPVRARVNVTFREKKSARRQGLEMPKESADRTGVWQVTEGDTLPLVAAREYGDPTAWRPIAEANDIHDPRTLRPGTELTVPPLDPEER